MNIDYYAYSSKIRNVNSLYKFIMCIFTLIACIVFNNIYLSMLVILLAAVINIFLGSIKISEYIRLLYIPVFFLVFSSVAIIIDISRYKTGDFSLKLGDFYFYITLEKIYFAINIIFKAMAAISSMYVLILSTPNGELINILKKFHIPDIIIELMNLIYRFIFILLDIHSKMKLSAESRLGYIDFKTSCMSFSKIATNILVVSMKKSENYYNAMESRCYNGTLEFLEEKGDIKLYHIIGAVIYIIIVLLIGILA